jgi:hypothetical protein
VLVLPDDLDPGHLGRPEGAFCANGLRHAAADRVVPTCVVGLITALLTRQQGAAEILVAESRTLRREKAEALESAEVIAEHHVAYPVTLA